MNTPLFDKIAKHISQGKTGFHTPGHQQGKGCSEEYNEEIRKYLLEMDLTELFDLDNLKNPVGCIKEAQDMAARLFAARQTFFLVNGSTVGLQAAILAVNKAGGKIIVSRQAHISILNAFVLSGGYPVIAPVEVDYEWGIALGTPTEKIVPKIEENPDAQAVILPQPSYHGVGSDISQMLKITNKKGIPLIADEAHGAHLYFQDRLPLSAQKHKADIVVQSTHKTLGALTQASMLHINKEAWIKPVRRALDILQTTSPSYLLMASLDCVQSQMRTKGGLMVEKTFQLAQELNTSIRNLPGYRIFADELKEPWYCDPTKLVLSANGLGLTGWELAAILRKNYGIEVELSDYFYILIMLTIGHSSADVTRLTKALADICVHERKKSQEVLSKPASIYDENVRLSLTPREVFGTESEEIPMTQSVGRIAGEPMTVYPPGIPLVWPGQLIELQHLDYLHWAKSCGFPIHGVLPDDMITVLKKV